MIALDTTAIIDLFKGEENLKRILSRITEPLASTHLNYLELLFGIDPLNSKHVEEMKYYDDLFSELTVLLLDEPSCKRAAEVFSTLNHRGKSIGKFDCIVTGIVLHHGITKILTRNVRHFDEVPGLKVLAY